MKTLRILAAGILAAALTTGCVRVYKIDVQQGNELSEQQMAALEVGMHREAVRALLGTPLIDDPFRADRWDYYYQMREGRSREVIRRQLSLFFEDDVLARVEGGLEEEKVRANNIDIEKLDEQLAEAAATEEEEKPGLWSRLGGMFQRSE